MAFVMASSTTVGTNRYATEDPSRFVKASKPYCPSDEQFREHVVHMLLDSDAAQTLCDVVLRTSDGRDVPACSALLAVHSEYFKSLFFSDFEEAHEKTVNLNISERVVRHILEFVYTGHCAFVKELVEACGSSSSSYTSVFKKHEQLPTLLQLSAAAEYHGIKLLHAWCDSTLRSVCERFPRSACSVLQAMSTSVANHPSSSTLLDIIRRKWATAFNVPESVKPASCYSSYTTRTDNNSDKYGILELSPHALDMAFPDCAESTYHEYLFQCIFFWVTNGTTLKRGYELRPIQTSSHLNGDVDQDRAVQSGGVEPGAVYVDCMRLEWGKKFAARLNLKSMRIRYVHDYVIPTGLIEKVDLMDMLWNYVLSNTSTIYEV